MLFDVMLICVDVCATKNSEKPILVLFCLFVIYSKKNMGNQAIQGKVGRKITSTIKNQEILLAEP